MKLTFISSKWNVSYHNHATLSLLFDISLNSYEKYVVDVLQCVTMIKYVIISSLLVLQNIAMEKDPILIAGLFEGDIAGLSSRDIAILHGEAKKTKSFFRNAVILKRHLWPKNTIPFVFAGVSKNMLITISNAMKEFEKKTCIR